MPQKRSHDSPRTQETKPKKGKPAEIPIPKKRDVLRDLTKIAKSRERDSRDSAEE